MRVLIVKLTSMGDVVHALPAVTDMARQVPGIVVDWVVEAPFVDIVALHPQVRCVIPQAWRRWRKHLADPATWAAMRQFRQALRAHPYDWVLDLQGLLKSAVVGKMARGPMVGYDRHSVREPWASLLYTRGVSVSRSLHAVQRCRQLAAAHLGYPLPSGPADFGLTSPPLAVEGWAPPPRYAVLVPGASRPEKLWPEADWIHVGQYLASRGLPAVVLWGSAQESQRAWSIARGCGGDVPPFLTVAQAAAVLAGAALVVGLDTGFSHLAAALRRPTLGLYCDHEPGLAGITGPQWTSSLGGRGQCPSLAAVMERVREALALPDIDSAG